MRCLALNASRPLTDSESAKCSLQRANQASSCTALAAIAGHPVGTIRAGRTDAGVHACSSRALRSTGRRAHGAQATGAGGRSAVAQADLYVRTHGSGMPSNRIEALHAAMQAAPGTGQLGEIASYLCFA